MLLIIKTRTAATYLRAELLKDGDAPSLGQIESGLQAIAARLRAAAADIERAAQRKVVVVLKYNSLITVFQRAA